MHVLSVLLYWHYACVSFLVYSIPVQLYLRVLIIHAFLLHSLLPHSLPVVALTNDLENESEKFGLNLNFPETKIMTVTRKFTRKFGPLQW